jgi:selenophosphate synthase
MRDYTKTATEIGKLVSEKQEAYGDSFSKSEEIIKILYPNGIKPENYRDLLTITRIIDKLFRIATRKDAFGESPYRDITGYGLLGTVSDLEKEKKNSR